MPCLSGLSRRLNILSDSSMFRGLLHVFFRSDTKYSNNYVYIEDRVTQTNKKISP